MMNTPTTALLLLLVLHSFVAVSASFYDESPPSSREMRTREEFEDSPYSSSSSYHQPLDDQHDLLHRRTQGTHPDDGTYVVEERNHHYRDVVDPATGEANSRFVHPLPQQEHVTEDGKTRPLFSPHSLHNPGMNMRHYHEQQKSFRETGGSKKSGNNHKGRSLGFHHETSDLPSSHHHPHLYKVEDTYLTPTGHRMRKLPDHDCHDAVLKACFPNKRGADFGQHVHVSTLAKCLTGSDPRRHIMPRRCQPFMAQFKPCLGEFTALCPDENHDDTVACMDKVWSQVSSTCRSSDWYLHNLAHDYSRQSSLRHHDDDVPDHLKRNHLEDPYTTPEDVHDKEDGATLDTRKFPSTVTVDGDEYFGEL